VNHGGVLQKPSGTADGANVKVMCKVSRPGRRHAGAKPSPSGPRSQRRRIDVGQICCRSETGWPISSSWRYRAARCSASLPRTWTSQRWARPSACSRSPPKAPTARLIGTWSLSSAAAGAENWGAAESYAGSDHDAGWAGDADRPESRCNGLPRPDVVGRCELGRLLRRPVQRSARASLRRASQGQCAA
jgi:hypothetical protein